VEYNRVFAALAANIVIHTGGTVLHESSSEAVTVRTNMYLNNLIEQDHRAIKRRCASMAGFKSFANAAITIAGIELAHRIRKRQFSFGGGRWRRGWSRKAEWAMALA
jgi:transposase-like protein